jgi:hypothetical protein
MRGAIHPLPQFVFMAWCLVKRRDNFTFTFISITNMALVLTSNVEDAEIFCHNLFTRNQKQLFLI